MSQELHDARQRVTDLENDATKFRIPDGAGLGTVLPHDYGTGTRYGLVVQIEPDVRVIWFTGVAETVDHLLDPKAV